MVAEVEEDLLLIDDQSSQSSENHLIDTSEFIENFDQAANAAIAEMINRPPVLAINDQPQPMDISPTIHPPPELSLPSYIAPEFTAPETATELVTITEPKITPECATASVNGTEKRDFVSTHHIRRYAQMSSPGKVSNTSKSSEVIPPTNIPTTSGIKLRNAPRKVTETNSVPSTSKTNVVCRSPSIAGPSSERVFKEWSSKLMERSAEMERRQTEQMVKLEAMMALVGQSNAETNRNQEKSCTRDCCNRKSSSGPSSSSRCSALEPDLAPEDMRHRRCQRSPSTESRSTRRR